MLRRTVVLLAFGVAVLGLAGCQLHLSVDIDVDRDGGGTLSVTLGADAELLARADAAGADPLGDLVATAAELPSWRVTDRDDTDGGRSVILSASFSDPAEFATLAAELSEGLAAPEVRLLEPFTIQLHDDTVRLRGAAGLLPTEHVTELGLLPEDAVRLAREQEAVVYSVRAAMPGQVLDTNATEHEERTATWTIPPGQRVAMRVTAERPARRLGPELVAAAVTVLVVAAILASVALRRRARSG